MIINALKIALVSLWTNKVRTVLNLLGVVIGVFAVTVLVSLGQGLKNNVGDLIQGFGTNVLFVVSGNIDTTNPSQANQINPADFVSGNILTVDDVNAIKRLPHVSQVAPMSLVAGALSRGTNTASATIVGTYPNILDAIEVLKIDKGAGLTATTDPNSIVLGSTATKQLFGDSDPIGQTVTLNKRTLTVIGTLKPTKTSSLFGSSFDSITMIPFDTATSFNRNQVSIYRIVVKADDSANVSAVKDAVNKVVLTKHDNQKDFTVLTQDDLLGLFTTFVNLSTTLVSAIAAISLIVGGIGIMNIMLVTVTERTREIGLRKAVGATNGAILFQFLIEAVTITLAGALIGLALSFVAGEIIKAKTDLAPSITPIIIVFAVGVSVIIGVIFGLWPAVRAAKKDPIQALRYE